MAYKLKLNKAQFNRPGSTLGMHRFLRGLGESPLFDLEFHSEYVNAMRGLRGTVIYFEDKKIYLDLWEYPTPAHTMEVYKANFDLIIKVQHKDISETTYNRYCDRKRLMVMPPEDRNKFLKKFVPWTFFPSKMMLPFIGREDEMASENYPIERDCFFCGKAWKCRSKLSKSLPKQGIEYLTSSQESAKGNTLSSDEYLHKMRSSKYGLVLQGRGSMLTDSKNRREIDYMILKKPLLLDYKPFYYNPLIPGKHFILIDQNTRIDSLESMYNIEEIAQNGYEWYKQNATTEALPKTFLQIMNERLS
ncbi:MAG: hypothetical protein WC119_02255 [Synergistaceae bacterium]